MLYRPPLEQGRPPWYEADDDSWGLYAVRVYADAAARRDDDPADEQDPAP